MGESTSYHLCFAERLFKKSTDIRIQSEFCFQITIKKLFLINNHYKTIYESAFLHGVNCQAISCIPFPPLANNKVTI